MLSAARVGDSRVLVLRGEPGIGKTALLQEAEELVGDMRVLRARGVESEQYLPFAGLLQLLRPVLPLLDQIPAPRRRALASALLLESAEEAEPSRFAVGAATLSLLSRAAEDRPLAVLLDDAHLLDSPTVAALVFAARRLLSDAVAVVATVRDGTPGSADWEALPFLEVQGLDAASAEQLLSSTAHPVRRDLVDRLHRATGGNPLALLELGSRSSEVEAMPPEAPLPVSKQLSRSFMDRVEQLDADTRQTLLVAAADSSSLATVVAAAARLGVRPTLAGAEDAGLVLVAGDSVEFRHPLVGAAVYGAAGRDQRRAVHRALADVMPSKQFHRLAWHLAQSAVPPDELTAQMLEEVAEQASARGAYAIASAAHERAAALTVVPDRVARRLTAAGETAWLAGSTNQAMDLLERALAGDPEPLLRAHVEEVRAAVDARSGSLDRALARLQVAADAVQITAPETAVRLLADVIHVSFYLADPAAARQAATQIEVLTPAFTDPDVTLLGSMAVGMALVLSGAGAEGMDRMRGPAYELAAHPETADDRFRLPLRLQGALWVRDSGPLRELVLDAVERLRDQAALGALPYLLMHIARDGATSDRWDDAEAAYAEAIRLARETGQTTDLAVSLAGAACLHARQGRADQCLSAAKEARRISDGNHVRLATMWAELAQGDLAAVTGDLAEAVRHYEELESLLVARHFADPDQSCAPELVETYVHLGRTDDAAELARRFDELARAKAAPWSLARAERALGLCAAGPAADAHFTAALELHGKTPDLYETARTELAFGAHLRRERRRVEARPVLRSALARFEQLGARPWADKAAQELQATGETVRRRGPGVTEELTPQERQIASLLAQGRTTREAAAALFLSPKTVEYHLRHVYLKLGISSRDALAERFRS